MADTSWALTAKMVARRFKVETETIYEWVRVGKLTCLRLPGGGYRFTPEDLAEFDRRCRGQGSESPTSNSDSEGDTGSSVGQTPTVVALNLSRRNKLKKLRQRSSATST